MRADVGAKGVDLARDVLALGAGEVGEYGGV